MCPVCAPPAATRGSQIFIASHRGVACFALLPRLHGGIRAKATPMRHEPDLLDQGAAHGHLAQPRPARLVIAATFVSGIVANDAYLADFVYESRQMESNPFHDTRAANGQGTEADIAGLELNGCALWPAAHP